MLGVEWRSLSVSVQFVTLEPIGAGTRECGVPKENRPYPSPCRSKLLRGDHPPIILSMAMRDAKASAVIPRKVMAR
jgi:hypothetical protein